jgi:4-deoxy-L-threo-5-hexosulose-uronate ketol-isomerase
LKAYAKLKANYFLERREIGIINVGEKGVISVDGKDYPLENKCVLYIGKGSNEVLFKSANSKNPAKYFLTSAPAHAEYPVQSFSLDQAEPFHTGAAETCNQRTVYKFIHEKGIQSCQLVMGLTMFKAGSIWNTMPPHVHDRRMEAYFYFDMP